MKNIIKLLANKVVYAAFVVLGAFAASAELVKTPILDDAGVSVGYKVTGLENGEVAMVYTNHLKTATWTVPYGLENVEFLVVGGGGGGGASTDDALGGGGGGGGCVVTGILKNVSLNSSILIKVGSGTKGGTYTAGKTDKVGAAGESTVDKNASYFLINGTTNVIAYCGGREMGWRKTASYTSGGYGGSNAGSRNTTPNGDYPDGRPAYINSANMLCYNSLQKGGGVAYADAPAAAGGGGGATQVGSDSYKNGEARNGGNGGEGLSSGITGTRVVYGSGGGGGTTRSCQTYWADSAYTDESLPGKGGEGAGNGGSYGGAKYKDTMNPGKNALANQGGGGGGGGNKANGGNGGSGIVVFRYRVASEKPAVVNPVYNGTAQVGVSGDGFTVVSGTVTATEVGTYTAIVRPNEGTWADGTTGDFEVTWKILPIMTGLEINENHGYVVPNLGNGEVAVVFTNENAGVINWTAPAALNNVEFLVVGGGGGGGGDISSKDPIIGGGGGGGGGVVTGIINRIEANADIGITVGVGGEGGIPGVIKVDGAGYGSSKKGGDSVFTISSVEYVKAYGGGNDLGSLKNLKEDYLQTGAPAGGQGGSSAGSRPSNFERTPETKGWINPDIEDYLKCSGTLGSHGGAGPETPFIGNYAAAGGGGGAVTPGNDATSFDNDNHDGSLLGGNGGEGLTSSIIGNVVVYGSGGGGGSTMLFAPVHRGGKGGTGAGNGGNVEDYGGSIHGTSALANQGGGGGGAGRQGTGGNGGSGIVVFRFAYSPVAAVNGYGYTDIAEAINAANGGTVTLVANVESINLNNSLTLKTDVYSVNAVTLANENAVLTTDKKLNVISGVEDYEVVETVEAGVYTYSLEVVISTYTITLPEVTGAKWYYGDSAVVGNTITVESGTDVTLTLKADSGYAFENGKASITVNIGNVTADVVVNDSQYVAPSEKQPSGKIDSFQISQIADRDGLELEIYGVFARESLTVKVFGSKGDCLTETTYMKAFPCEGALTCSIVISGSSSSSWSTEYNAEKLTVDNMPAKVELWIDGKLIDELNKGLSEADAQKYRDYDFVKDAEEPDTVVDSDTWGGIDWTLTEKGVLTIKPTAGEPTQIANRPKTFVRGEWPEAVRYNTKGEGVEIAGWPYDRSKVKKLVIEEGVTKIGSFTAQGFNNLTGEVVIPWTVTYIGQEAFQRSQFTKLTFGKVPEGKTGEELCIAQGAFKNLEIEEATLPDDRPVHLHAWIFNNCHKLKRVTFPATIKSMHGTNHIDYFKNFESHSNPTWTKSSELLAYDESIEVVTFGSEEVKNMFFNINNGTSKDYIKAVVGLKAYGKLQLAIDEANAGDTIKLIKDITENITVNKPINFTGKTIKGEITIDSEANLIVKRDANGKIIGVVVPEAEINSVKYAPVQEAIDAAQDGAVITLIADVTLTESLKVDEGKTITLDLNGHNITMDESLAATGYAIENSGTLTLIDSGRDSGSVQSRGILNNGTLYVENGTYNAVGDGSAIVNNGEAYLTGGTFTAESGYSLNNASGATMSIGSRMRRMFAGVVVANGIYSNGDLLINGGEIYDNSGRNAICVDGDNAANSSAVINGGTITGGLSVNEGAGLEIAGGVFNGDKDQNYDIKGNISIKGGAFLDDAAKAFAHDNVTLKDNEVLTVTDEVFANLLRSKKGYYVSQNANYSYSIMLKSSFRLFVTAVNGKPRLGFFQDHAAGAKACTLLGATNLEKPDWTPVAYSDANDASNASDHPLKWVKINETKDSTKVYRFFKIAE